MQFKVQTEEELMLDLLPVQPGIREFKVVNFEEKVSKAGNPMVVMTIQIWDDSGRSCLLKDFVTDTPFGRLKIRHFLRATLQEHLIERGSFDVFCAMNKTGYCKVGEENVDGKKYLKIEDYLTGDEEKKHANEDSQIIDNDIPF